MPADRPNVLWICTDQQRFDTLGCYGNDVVDTPTLDALASSGACFERAYCQNPVCSPSRGSMLTGRYPRTTGLRQNGQPVPDSEVFLPRLLAEAGYRTGLAGKLHVSPAGGPRETQEPVRRVRDGYGAVDYSHGPGVDQENDYGRWLAGQGIEYETTPTPESAHVAETVPTEYHQTTWCADRAVEFIRAAGEEPWLYSLNIFDPHPPFDAPAEYLDRYRDRLDDLPEPNYVEGELADKPVWQRDKHEGTNNRGGPAHVELDREDHLMIRAAYYAMCDLIDDAVGTVLDALDHTGQREDTLVVFTSDHGTMLGDHGLYVKGPYFYEGAVRVPLLVSGPGVESRRVEDVVELVDVAPTLLEAAGEPVHPGMQGESLWPHLSGDGVRETDSAYCEFYNASTQHTDPKAYATMLRTDRHKLVAVHDPDQPGELYDLRADPEETENLWADPDYLDVKARLLDRLAERMARTADPLPERQSPW
jgi:choline-sulfatase